MLDVRLYTSLGAVLLFGILQHAASTTTSPTPTVKQFAYFNQTSQLILPRSWHLRSLTQLSFKTCSNYGHLLSQETSDGEYLRLYLHNDSIVFSWNITNITSSSRIQHVYKNNQWFSVSFNFYLGNVYFNLTQGSDLLSSKVISSATMNQYLILSTPLPSTELFVGQNFVGCINRGPGVDFNMTGISENSVLWNQCLLNSGPQCTLDGDDCVTFPCQNGGTCIDGVRSYTCQCRHNFNGTNCENDLSYLGCSISPCMNGGTCTDNVPGTFKTYTCNCAKGYAGGDCDIEIDNCRAKPCRTGICTNIVGNGYLCNCTGTGFEGENCTIDIDECKSNGSNICGDGQCFNSHGSYTCDCPDGFDGKRCVYNIDECISTPCKNGGTCNNLLNKFTCSCHVGFTGDLCETNINDCEGVACRSANASCKDLVNDHQCVCNDGFTGTDPDCVDVDECLSNPCIPSQSLSCENRENMFVCQCKPGFTGDRCEKDIDECASNPCQNNATCEQGINSYVCRCLPGYTDKNCSTNIYECQSEPCQNGGTCNDEVNAFTCDCVAGWTGQRCETDFDECSSNPCKNNATCIDYLNYYNCSCVLGFTGVTCGDNINDCVVDPCLNGAQCVDLVNDYKCDCPADKMGKNCSLTYNACEDLTPCQNGATCNTQPPSRDYNCSCSPGFSGVNCSFNIDDCILNTCESYQHCYDGINNYTCGCPIGFEGEFCNIDTDECANNLCRNGASCINGTGDYTCKCKNNFYNLTQYAGHKLEFYSGFKGKYCTEDINECMYNPCLNGGVCENFNNGSFRCLCPGETNEGLPAGFNCHMLTTYCDIAAGRLKKPPCENGGTCNSHFRTYSCDCAPGWTGKNCEVNIDECLSNPCRSGGTCVDMVNGYNCTCIPGISGDNCEINIDECLSNPCLNNGQCLDLINAYICNCSDTGFDGENCDNDINECESSPCQNGGECLNGIKRYDCNCTAGYTGVHCEEDIKECMSSPCKYGGTCLERSNRTLYDMGVPGFTDFSYASAAGYVCLCIPGITGDNCETNIDECESSPCQNSGTCVDAINGYTCDCAPGYTGVNCETDIDECEKYRACANGAQCRDLVADYRCDCVPYSMSAGGYGGRNCTVRLTGCDSGSRCQHGSSCVPYYIDATQTHDYTCDCPSGYTGRFCGYVTTFTLKNATTVRTLSPQIINKLSLRFRTSVYNGILFSLQPSESEDDKLVIHLSRKKLRINYRNLTSFSINSIDVNDAQWHSVTLTMGTNIIITLDSSLCHQLSDCRQSFTNQWTVPTQGHVSIGMDTSYVPFIGCMQDVMVNDFVVYQTLSEFVVHMKMEWGCPRTQQCEPYTCNRNGDCQDLWYKFECNCYRPHYGQTCDEEYIPATFAKDGQESFANFSLPSIDLKRGLDISLFIQTRQDNGVIMYAGNAAQSDVALAFVTIEMMNGKIGGNLVLCEQINRFSTPNLYKDGKKYFIQLKISDRELSLTVNNKNVVNKTISIPESCNTSTSRLYFGKIPNLQNQKRRKRDISQIIGTSSLFNYEGIVQDVRINNEKLAFFNTSSDGSFILADTQMFLTEGAVSTRQICYNTTCENDGICTAVLFNDFKCNCTKGYIGKNCSDDDFCNSDPCPSLSQCKSRQDGYECIAEGTFDGRNSRVSYTPSVQSTTDLSTFSLYLRTHSLYSLILYLQNGDHFFKLRLEDGNLVLNYKLTDGMSEKLKLSNYQLNNGSWFFAEIQFMKYKICLRIKMAARGRVLDENSADVTDWDLTSMIKNNSVLRIGGLDLPMNVSGWEQPFKGCLKEIRSGEVLLPFFSDDRFINNTSSDKFLAMDIRSLTLGCGNGRACDQNQTMCRHNSQCIDTWRDFKCECGGGYDGQYCQKNKDDCQAISCQNRGQCIDGVGMAACNCPKGFSGDRCDVDIDYCSNDSCQNGGLCFENTSDFGCNCTSGWTGRTCTVLTNSTCSDSPCENGAQCTDINGTGSEVAFNCSCGERFEGTTCEIVKDYCSDLPCLNNATCVLSQSAPYYSCACPTGYTGDRCETDINDCLTANCVNGNCTDLVNDFFCKCSNGWTGRACTENINECNVSTPCQKGICIDTPGSFQCNCNGTGYNGTNCADEVDECSLDVNPCKNNGSCSNTEGSFECNCTLGYTGHDCANPDCNAGQCENNSTCTITTQNTWKCNCPLYYFGEQCETAGPCSFGYCDDMNTNTCEQNEVEMTYKCVCNKGWKGENCTEDIDECLNSPCLNGATCSNSNGSYSCQCIPGFSDKNCSTNIDDCANNVCQNGGTCNDYINDFNCTCPKEYTGKVCDKDVNECTESNPCKNNQPCINKQGSFSCNCSTDYLGDLCEISNPCVTTDCQNGGNCLTNLTNGIYQPFCECASGYEGVLCEKADPSRESDELNIWVIIGPIIAVIIVVIIVGVVLFLITARNKRATRGQYCPSQQETAGARVELGNVLKKPPHERLI